MPLLYPRTPPPDRLPGTAKPLGPCSQESDHTEGKHASFYDQTHMPGEHAPETQHGWGAKCFLRTHRDSGGRHASSQLRLTEDCYKPVGVQFHGGTTVVVVSHSQEAYDLV